MITLKPVINQITKEEEIEIIRNGIMIATFNAHDRTDKLPIIILSITTKYMFDFKLKTDDVMYPDGKERRVKVLAAMLEPQE